MKRLGILVFYDKDNIVDDYVVYLVEKISKCCERLVIVSNSFLNDEERSKFTPFATDYYERPNEGMDAGALKYFFCELSKEFYIENYDEVFWLNDTCYGPIYDMAEVFVSMEKKKELDFWGITINPRYLRNSIKALYNPEHVQSYFIAVRKAMLSNECFLEFWKTMPISNDFDSVVKNYELSFTSFFSKRGYIYAAYCNTLAITEGLEYPPNPTFAQAYELISEMKSPFLKRKNYSLPAEFSMIWGSGSELDNVIKYIRINTSYPVEMIYKNLIRMYSCDVLRQNINLMFIGSEDISDKYVDRNFLAIVFIESKEDLCFYSHYYLEHGLSILDSIIITKNKIILEEANSYPDFLFMRFETFDIENIFTSEPLREKILLYDYVCFIDFSQYECINPVSSLLLKRWLMNNLLWSKPYILNIAKIFNENKYVGALISEGDKMQFDSFGGIISEYIKQGIWFSTDVLRDTLFLKMNSGKERNFAHLLKKVGFLPGNVICISQAERYMANGTYLFKDTSHKKRKALEIVQYMYEKITINNIDVKKKDINQYIWDSLAYAIHKRLPIRFLKFKIEYLSLGVKNAIRLKKRFIRECRDDRKGKIECK